MPRRWRGVEWPRAGAIGIMAMGLMLAASGCAGPDGSRSSWSDRPSLLRSRDRKPSGPHDEAPRSRLAGWWRRGTSAKPKSDRDRDGGFGRTDESGPPGPDDDRIADRGPTALPEPDEPAPDDPEKDEAIRVTLGTPEPLPPLPGPAEPPPEPVPPDIDGGRSPARPEQARPVASRPAARPSRPSARPTARPEPSRPTAEDGAQAILAQSEAKLRSMGTYQVKMSRIERVEGKLQPEEEFLLSIRRKPREVRLEWASGPSKGREVIYSTRIDPRSLFVHMPSSAIPLPTMKMAIDSPMVVRSSRHSITEAGLDTIVESLRKSVDQVDADNTARGRAAYRGIEKPPGLDRPSHVFTRRSPNGESWTVFIDAKSMLPSMVVAKDPKGELDEKYVYHEVIEDPAGLATDGAFDPDKRWGAAKGLLSRFGKAAAKPQDSQDSPH